MSFVMPSKYGAKLPLPKDPSVRIKQVPQKIVAVTAFSGWSVHENCNHLDSNMRIVRWMCKTGINRVRNKVIKGRM